MMELVDQIVAEVMNQLGVQSESAETAEAPSGSTLHVAGRVITADVLAELVSDQSSVSLEAKAVVTPSAKDWLRQNNVEVVNAGHESEPAAAARQSKSEKDAGKKDVVFIVRRQCSLTESVIADTDKVASTRTIEEKNPDTTASKAIEAVEQGAKLVVVIASHGSYIAMLANRNQSVRAAAIHTVQEAKGVKAYMDANVVILNPSGRGFFELRNLVRSCMG